MDKVKLTPIKKIHHPKGDVYHALKVSDDDFSCFGEAYFTQIKKGYTKGWKKHIKMKMNLIVPVGDVTFYIHDQKYCTTKVYRINNDNYCRLMVPPGYWVAFEGNGEINIVLNIASMEHCQEEAENVDLSYFPMVPK